jgi:hypothetical protein
LASFIRVQARRDLKRAYPNFGQSLLPHSFSAVSQPTGEAAERLGFRLSKQTGFEVEKMRLALRIITTSAAAGLLAFAFAGVKTPAVQA